MHRINDHLGQTRQKKMSSESRWYHEHCFFPINMNHWAVCWVTLKCLECPCVQPTLQIEPPSVQPVLPPSLEQTSWHVSTISTEFAAWFIPILWKHLRRIWSNLCSASNLSLFVHTICSNLTQMMKIGLDAQCTDKKNMGSIMTLARILQTLPAVGLGVMSDCLNWRTCMNPLRMTNIQKYAQNVASSMTRKGQIHKSCSMVLARKTTPRQEIHFGALWPFALHLPWCAVPVIWFKNKLSVGTIPACLSHYFEEWESSVSKRNVQTHRGMVRWCQAGTGMPLQPTPAETKERFWCASTVWICNHESH